MNHLHSVLCRHFGNRSGTVWSTFSRPPPFQIKARCSALICVGSSKPFSVWMKDNPSCSCLGYLQRSFTIPKLSLHSSRNLLQGNVDDVVHNNLEESDNEKDVKNRQERILNISLVNTTENEKNCGRKDQDQQIQVEKNSLDSESLNNSSTIAERVSVLGNAEYSAEGSFSETENSGSISQQKTVALTPGSVFLQQLTILGCSHHPSPLLVKAFSFPLISELGEFDKVALTTKRLPLEMGFLLRNLMKTLFYH